MSEGKWTLQYCLRCTGQGCEGKGKSFPTMLEIFLLVALRVGAEFGVVGYHRIG
jgi:hypothetical protein